MSNDDGLRLGDNVEEDAEMDEEFNDLDEQINTKVTSANTTGKDTNGSSSTGATSAASLAIPDLPELTRKDKTLQEVLDLMDGDFAPIIPDAVTDYCLSKNGFETSDVKIKRLLALATQKFILDITQDAYEYSRIRNSSAVYNSSNPQVRAKQLLQGQQYANQQLLTGAGGVGAAGIDGGQGEQLQPAHTSSNAGNQQGKIVLTMEDLSSALSEYGMNTTRPDFYR